MSDFTNFSGFEPVLGTRTLYRLTKPLRYEIGRKGSGWWLVVDAETEFDISVPRWLEWAQSPHDKEVLLASLIHDVLGNRRFGVGFASSEFRRAAQALGSSTAKAWLLFTVTLWFTAIWRLLYSE